MLHYPAQYILAYSNFRLYVITTNYCVNLCVGLLLRQIYVAKSYLQKNHVIVIMIVVNVIFPKSNFHYDT